MKVFQVDRLKNALVVTLSIQVFVQADEVLHSARYFFRHQGGLNKHMSCIYVLAFLHYIVYPKFTAEALYFFLYITAQWLTIQICNR